MDEKQLLDEIHSALRAVANSSELVVDRRFHKHDEYVSYEIKTADFRRVVKEYKSRIMELTLDQRLTLAKELFALNIGILGHTAISVLTYSVDELTPEHFPLLDEMMDHYRSWSHVDNMCLEVLQPLLLKYPDPTIEQLELWNQSENRFKRRSSVVVFVRKIGKSGQYTDLGLRLCEDLIWDEQDIVQKGVGWALKDMMRGDRDRIIDYVKDLRNRGVSAVITLYAIRDLKGEERKQILKIGKS